MPLRSIAVAATATLALRADGGSDFLLGDVAAWDLWKGGAVESARRGVAASLRPSVVAAATGINRRVRARAGSVGVAAAVGRDGCGIRVCLVTDHSDGIQGALYPLVNTFP